MRNLYVINAFQELEDENGKFYGAYDSDIMRGIQWAAGKNCRVVSMSLSGSGEPNGSYGKYDSAVLFPKKQQYSVCIFRRKQ